jgi:hypothetical protein
LGNEKTLFPQQLTPTEAKGMAHYTCPQCMKKKEEDTKQEDGVLVNSDSQPTKKETRKRTIKAKPKAAPKPNSRTYNPIDDHDATKSTTLSQPPLKRRRALPNITTASPQKQNLLNNTSPVQQPIRARAKIMVIPHTTEDFPISPLSTTSSIDTTSHLVSPTPISSTIIHEEEKETNQPSFIGMLNDDCLLFICKIVGEQSINNLLTFMGVCRRWRMVALSPSAVSLSHYL